METFILAVLAVIVPLFLAFLATSIKPEKSYETLMGEYVERARKRGLTPKQMTDELCMREALIRARNKASAWAIRDPWSWYDAMKVSLENEGRDLPKHLHRRWTEWTAQLLSSDVFTKQAQDAISAHEKKHEWKNPPWQRKPTADEIAALRIE